MSNLSWTQPHTPCNRCVRFATTVASGHATLATKQDATLYLGRTCTGWIAPALRLAHLFDHLIGDCEQVRRNSEAQSAGSSPIDDELNLCGLGNRQIPRRFSVEKARRANSHATISIGQIASVAHQPASPCEAAIGSYRRHRMTGRRATKGCAFIREHDVRGDHHRPDPLLLGGYEGLLELTSTVRVQHLQIPIEHAGRFRHLPQFWIRSQALWIDEKGDRGCVRDNLHDPHEPRRVQFLIQDAHAGCIPARPIETTNQTHCDWIAAARERDRYGRGCGLCGARRSIPEGANDRYVAAHQIGCQPWQSVELTIRAAKLKRHISVLDVVRLGKTLPK